MCLFWTTCWHFPDSNIFHKSSSSAVVHFCVKMFPFAVHQPRVYWCSWLKKTSVWAKCAQFLLSFCRCCKWPHGGEQGGLGWHLSSSSAADLNTIQRPVCNCKRIEQSFNGEKRCPCSHSFLFFQNVLANKSSVKGHFQTVPDTGLLTEKRN